MEKVVALLLAVVGVLVVIYVFTAWKGGAVRAGHNFGTPIYHTRRDSPGLFYLFLLIYLVGGIWAAGAGIGSMIGVVDLPKVD